MVTLIIIAVLITIILVLLILIAGCMPGGKDATKGCGCLIGVAWIIFIMYLGGKYLW